MTVTQIEARNAADLMEAYAAHPAELDFYVGAEVIDTEAGEFVNDLADYYFALEVAECDYEAAA